jgi:hypothetical protein
LKSYIAFISGVVDMKRFFIAYFLLKMKKKFMKFLNNLVASINSCKNLLASCKNLLTNLFSVAQSFLTSPTFPFSARTAMRLYAKLVGVFISHILYVAGNSLAASYMTICTHRFFDAKFYLDFFIFTLYQLPF